ncbi:unnamed protein product [Mytilus edulis]|uniref:Uncharacterized protein n=1 Tax=Mytilus edulis TaxID=6550 RepID=A0A8S3UQ47_MYTED|nr:unnamed protein product [Mytilus edulis]
MMKLPTLSQNWYGALRDYGYLSLPSEYSSQLPSEGGTFYHPDTIESAKQHYKQCWPSILHALTIWLKETEFTNKDKDDGNEKNVPANMNDVNKERFFLLLGVTMEALTNHTTVIPELNFMSLLKGLHAMVVSDWPRKYIAEDPVLSVEILTVMHRTFLTRENLQLHLVAADVVKQVILSYTDFLDSQKIFYKEKESPVSTESSTESMDTTDSNVTVGEGGESGEIEQGKSLVFAALEACMCVISKHIPVLNPSAPTTGFQAPARRLSDECCQLIAAVVSVLGDLPSLCSPAGSTNVLPTVLYLITGVLREMSSKSAERKSPAVVTSCLCTLKSLCTSSFLSDDTISGRWSQLLQSALKTVLNSANQTEEKPAMDDVTLLGTVTIFLLYAPPEIVDCMDIRNQCLDMFLNTWASHIYEIQLKSIQMFTSVIQHLGKERAGGFIKGFAPKLAEYLLRVKDNVAVVDDELNIVIASLGAFESLVPLADDDKKLTVLTIFIPILVSFLLDDFDSASTARGTLHEDSLQRLMKIGPQYPTEFRTIMAGQSILKSKLESAIKLSQTAKKIAVSKSNSHDLKATNVPIKPRITRCLKRKEKQYCAYSDAHRSKTEIQKSKTPKSKQTPTDQRHQNQNRHQQIKDTKIKTDTNRSKTPKSKQTPTGQRHQNQNRHQQIKDTKIKTDTNRSKTLKSKQTPTDQRHQNQNRHQQVKDTKIKTDTNRSKTPKSKQTPTDQRHQNQNRHQQVKDTKIKTDTNRSKTPKSKQKPTGQRHQNQNRHPQVKDTEIRTNTHRSKTDIHNSTNPKFKHTPTGQRKTSKQFHRSKTLKSKQTSTDSHRSKTSEQTVIGQRHQNRQPQVKDIKIRTDSYRSKTSEQTAIGQRHQNRSKNRTDSHRSKTSEQNKDIRTDSHRSKTSEQTAIGQRHQNRQP